jgi:pimeloyl-ACP methyl ester carboxylesterase
VSRVDQEVSTFPGAVAPDRIGRVDAHGVGIATYEWGEAGSPPLFIAHGGFDFARTFDVFAPLLAAGGWRVVAWDQRGHGDSDHVALYSWDADLRDAVAVMQQVTTEPSPVIGHSKTGALVVHLADAQPHRFSHVVNLDGLPSRRPWPDVANHERTRLLAAELESWLDHRRKADRAVRRPGTIDDLAQRRGRMNPRLDRDWLRYLVTVGAREDEDGWRWKIDPSMRFGGFGPWRPEWAVMQMPGLSMPFLGVLGLQPEAMGWGTRPEDVLPYLPLDGQLEVLDDVGHFVHIEQPERVAAVVLDFLGR